MIPGGDVRVWLASGVTDMRRGMNTLAQVQEAWAGTRTRAISSSSGAVGATF